MTVYINLHFLIDVYVVLFIYSWNLLGCLEIKVPEARHSNFSSREFFRDLNISINFSALVKATLDFSVKTVNFNTAGPITPPDCVKFDIQVL